MKTLRQKLWTLGCRQTHTHRHTDTHTHTETDTTDFMIVAHLWWATIMNNMYNLRKRRVAVGEYYILTVLLQQACCIRWTSQSDKQSFPISPLSSGGHGVIWGAGHLAKAHLWGVLMLMRVRVRLGQAANEGHYWLGLLADMTLLKIFFWALFALKHRT